MKTTLRILLLLSIFFGGIVQSARSQLVAGDIAFTGYNSEVTPATGGPYDSFSFVILRTGGLPANTVINFTDCGWINTNPCGTDQFFTENGISESSISWTSPGSVLAYGTQVTITGPNADVGTVTFVGTTSPANVGLTLTIAGDQIIAYQGPKAANTIIAAITCNIGAAGSTTDADWDIGTVPGTSPCIRPTCLTNGVNAVILYTGANIPTGAESDNARLTCLNLTGVRATDLAYCNNRSNWSFDDAAAFTLPAPSCCSNPTVPSLAVSSSTICPGGSSTITISGTLNSATSWQIYTGSCGGTLIGSTATSTFVVNPSVSTTYYIRGEGGCVIPGSCASITVNVNPTITLTANSQTNVSCNGGTNGAASVNAASGGAGGFTYNWTPGNPTGDGSTSVTGLTAGTWTCTVTDANSCTASVNFNITAPTALVLNANSQTNVSCNGGNNGAASVVPASGGAGGYMYNWTPGNPTGDGTVSVTGLTAGTWTCTVTDANSCTTFRNFTITQPTALALTAASQTNVACNGGSTGAASVNTATGGAGGYSYNWTPGNPAGDGTTSVTGLTAGTWTCTVTDANACTAAVNFTITQPTAIVLTAASQTNVACNGGSTGAASVNTATGGAGGYSYNWTPGNPTGDGSTSVTGLTAGTWTCTVTDANACTAAVNFTITQPTAISATAASQTNVSCNGGTNGAASINTPTGGAGGYTYNWTPGNPAGDGTTSVTGLTAGTWTCTVTDVNSCTAAVNFTITQPTALSLTAASQTNVACNGGSTGAASVNTATGGAGGYSYNWTPGNPAGDGTTSVTGLTAGTWTCTVTDANSCTAAVNFTITQPTALSLTAASQTNVSCNGGTNGAASVNVASGGAGGYTYNWTPGNPTGDGTISVSGLTAGTWTCTVTDANACTAAVNFTITQPTAIVLTAASQTNVACNGGSTGAASVNTATGGAGGYSYNWTPGNPAGDGTTSVTGLTAGTWTCTVTDANACTAAVNFTITQPTAIVLTAASQTNVACNGGSTGAASVNAATGGAGGYSYNWTPGNPAGDGTTSVTGLTAGTWTCTVTDANSCTAAVNFTITQPTALSLTAASQTNVSCNGGTNGAASVNVASGGAGGYTYNWTPGNPTGDGTISVSGLTAGTWTCTVTDANACTAAVNFTITQPTAIVLTAASQTNVACNGGSTGAASVNAATGGAGGYVYDWTPGNPTGDGTISVTGLTAGTWTCTVTDANACTAAVNFTITQPTSISASISSTNTSCTVNNGTATVSAVSGGAGGYTYDWTPGNPTGEGTTSISDLGAGPWTCTITDVNGCTLVLNTTVSTASAPTLTAAAQTNVSCNGGANGAASVNAATGGAGGYVYDWTPGTPTGDGTTSVSGLTAGSYTCTVTDAGGCTASVNFNITQPTALSVTAAVTSNYNGSQISCNGAADGMITATPGGGVPGYTLSWSDGQNTINAINLAPGNYSVTVTDLNGCTAVSNTVTIVAPPALTASPSQTNVSCFGGSNGTATAVVTGGTGSISFDWAPGTPTGDGTNSVSGLTAGTWTCTATDANGCTSVTNFTITEPTAIVLTAASQTNVGCNGGSDGAASVNTATGGSGTLTYDWTPGTPNGDGTTAITGLTAGTYTCTVTDGNGCTAAVNFTITQPGTVINTPVTSGVTVCQGDASAEVTGSATTSATTSASITIPIDVAAQPAEVSATSVPATVAASPNPFATATMAALPAGAVVTSASLNYNGIQATGASWQSDVRLGLTGPIDLNWTNGSAVNASGTFNYSAAIPAGNVNPAGGTITMHYFDFWNDNVGAESTFPAGTGVASITINYTLPVTASVTWWDAASGGTQIGTGSPFETVGTSVLPNTNTPGTYTVYAQGESGGCPSANRTATTVIVNATSSSTTVIASCNSYMWTNGTTYTVSGIYTQTLTNAVGCDSIATLDLTINYDQSSTTTITACDSYLWTNGTTYTTSGIYTQTLTSVNGCDSVATLDLTINNATAGAETVATCDSYLWAADGQTYTSSGTYTATLTNAAGCDSIATLNLTINTGSTSTQTVTECESYTWSENGQTYTSSGLYEVTYTGANGCDSVIQLDLIINNGTSSTETIIECESYTWPVNGQTYTASGIYVETLTGANGCDSILNLDLTITGFPTATATDNGDATITASAGATYQWIDCTTGQAIVGGTNQTITIAANGDYAVVVTNAGGCSDTSDCVTIDYIGLAEQGTAIAQIFPNPTKDLVTITIAASNVQLELVDANGKTLHTTSFSNETNLDLSNYPVGVYLIRLKTENDVIVNRVVKQ